MRVMGAFASRRVYPPAPRLNCRALSFFVRLSAHAHISRERLGIWFRGRDSNPRQPAYEAGLEPSPGTPICMAGTVGNRTHHTRFWRPHRQPWNIRPYMDRNPTCEVGTPSRIEGVMLFHQFRVLMCGRGFVTPHSAGSVQRAFFPSEVAT